MPLPLRPNSTRAFMGASDGCSYTASPTLIVRESNDELFVVACYHLHRDAKVWQSRG
jgi:hypothetical protein